MEKITAKSGLEAGLRSFCKFCGTKMQMARIDPALEPDHDRITYECPKCAHSFLRELPSISKTR